MVVVVVVVIFVFFGEKESLFSPMGVMGIVLFWFDLV